MQMHPKDFKLTRQDWLTLDHHDLPEAVVVGPGVGPRVNRYMATTLLESERYKRYDFGVLVRADIATPAPLVGEAVMRTFADVQRRGNGRLTLSMSSAFAQGATNGILVIGAAARKPIQPGMLVDVMRVRQAEPSNFCYEELSLFDRWGDLHLRRETDAMIFLQCHRGAAGDTRAHLSAADMRHLVHRMVTNYRNLDTALDQIRLCSDKLMRNGLGGFDLDKALIKFEKLFASNPEDVAPLANILTNDRLRAGVYWFGREVGTLVHTGVGWRYDVRAGVDLGPWNVESGVSGSLPPAIAAMMPEGANSNLGAERGGFHVDEWIHKIETGCRYMSNLVITPYKEKLSITPRDMLEGRISQIAQKGVFRGQVVDRDLLVTHQEIYANNAVSGPVPARISGVQLKAPTTLTKGGRLAPAVNTTFSHLLKIGSTRRLLAFTMPTNEWFCMSILKKAGLKTSDVALIPGTREVGNSILVERWDIPESRNDRRVLVAEDFMSLMGKPTINTNSKYASSMEDLALAVAKHSSDPRHDLKFFFDMTVAAWLLGNGDLHLKNLSVIKQADIAVTYFESAKLSPIYDFVCTAAIPGFRQNGLAIPLNGSHWNVSKESLLEFGTTSCGQTVDFSSRRIDALTTGILAQTTTLAKTLPPEITLVPEMLSAVLEVVAVIVNRASGLLDKPVEETLSKMGDSVREAYEMGAALRNLGFQTDAVLASRRATDLKRSGSLTSLAGPGLMPSSEGDNHAAMTGVEERTFVNLDELTELLAPSNGAPSAPIRRHPSA